MLRREEKRKRSMVKISSISGMEVMMSDQLFFWGWFEINHVSIGIVECDQHECLEMVELNPVAYADWKSTRLQTTSKSSMTALERNPMRGRGAIYRHLCLCGFIILKKYQSLVLVPYFCF